MNENTVVPFRRPAAAEPVGTNDPLTDLLRDGARKLIAEAVETELQGFLAQYEDKRLEGGQRALVRNGYQPERSLQTGIGPVPVKVPKVRDRSGSGIKFNSLFVPPYLRKTKSVEGLLPWLYLKGISTGDFQEALTSLLGPAAKGLSPSVIARLKQVWEAERKEWAESSLANKKYVYWWADGIHFNVRGEDARSCILVIVGVTETGYKEFVAIEEGLRESELSWTEVLTGLKKRGLKAGPMLAVGDGALGFWKALAKCYGETTQQRCWVHKTANVLNKLPKSSQANAKSMIHAIWMAETKLDAGKAFDRFLATYQDKYPKAANCLAQDREQLLAFYDFPAAHWQHIRTTNPIESTFATVRLRTTKTRGCVSRESILAMVFKLGMSAQRKWRRLRGFVHLAAVIEGVRFQNGLRAAPDAALPEPEEELAAAS
jgi:transposase-like protein